MSDKSIQVSIKGRDLGITAAGELVMYPRNGASPVRTIIDDQNLTSSGEYVTAPIQLTAAPSNTQFQFYAYSTGGAGTLRIVLQQPTIRVVKKVIDVVNLFG
jgi:hypothetical protein